MNKTININLGGYPFTIDEDAYAFLNDYLQKIKHHFHHSEGYEDIIQDIENRIAELLEERLKTKAILGLEDVKTVIAIMGTPEEFGAEAMEEDGPGSSQREYRTGKRLFRDPNDKIIGGVCSGVAAYFGITDPLWVRIGFAIVGFSAGIGVPIYLLLWALVPEAKSPADYLAMKGEPVNVQNIAKMVEEQVEMLSDQISELGEDWKKRRRKKKWKKRDRF
jgi:phage shock protein PspC (stress-responsive transcriptional regulator)